MTVQTEHPLDQTWPTFLDGIDSHPEEAFAGLHEFCWRLLLSRPPRVFGDLSTDDRHDLTADLVARLAADDFARLRTYRDRGLPFAGWVSRIATNMALDLFRKRKLAAALEPDPPPAVAHAAETLDRSRLLEAVREALRRIRRKCRLLLEAAADGYKPKEIALLLGYPPGAGKQVSDDLRSCRRTLKRMLEEGGHDLT